MNILSSLTKWFLPWTPFFTGLLVSLVVILLARHFLIIRFGNKFKESGWIRQLLMFFITVICIIGVIILLPMGDAARGQLLSLIGILATGAIALSSTTFIGNAMAGLMLRAVRHIELGDFLHVEGNFGRVTELGLLHTEIQTEDRDLTTLPNLFLVTNPVRVVRESGTIISATLSLGYDIDHKDLEPLLKKAAMHAGLEESFVHVVELGDFSITYRVAGFLKEVKVLLSARSRLRKEVLNVLHKNNIEIVSPTFMNQRAIKEEKKFIPSQDGKGFSRLPTVENEPENLIFDKADQAEFNEKLQSRIDRIEQTIERTKKILKDTDDESKKKRYEERLSSLESERNKIQSVIKDKG